MCNDTFSVENSGVSQTDDPVDRRSSINLGGNSDPVQEVFDHDLGCVALCDIADCYASETENADKELESPAEENVEEAVDIPAADNAEEAVDSVLPAAENADGVVDLQAAGNDIEQVEPLAAGNNIEGLEPPAAESGVFHASNSVELIHDESSKDSADSSMALISDLPQEPKAIAMALMKYYRKKLDKVSDTCKEVKENTAKLLGESEARDYLVAQNLAQQDEIEEHKHQRNVQEGKTAAQTRKANLSAANELKALEQVSISSALAADEKIRREAVETERSTLLVSNINMSTVLRNSSAGNEVALFLSLCLVLVSLHSNRKLGTGARKLDTPI